MAAVTACAGATSERAFAFDLDGTITTQEILPLIAERAGMGDSIHELTELTMAGLVPFEESLRRRFELLRHVPLSEVHEVVSEVELNEDLVAFIAGHLADCYVVTGNLDVWVAPLLERIGCRWFSSRASVHGDRLTALDRVLSKDTAVERLRRTYHRIVAVGDGANDVPLFQASSTSIAFGQVHQPAPALCAVSDYVVFTGSSLCRLLNTL